MDDPRLTPARGDLAAKYLEGKVKAARYVSGEEFCVTCAIAPLRERPAGDATLLTQALKGERVTIYDRNGEGFAWGQLNGDGYVGWIPDAALGKPAAVATHKVTALRTFAFPAGAEDAAEWSGREAERPGESSRRRGSRSAEGSWSRCSWMVRAVHRWDRVSRGPLPSQSASARAVGKSPRGRGA